MVGAAGSRNFRTVEDPGEAEVIVVNTCGFIQAAKEESIQTVLELAEQKKHGACRKLVMAGCLSQRYGADLEQAMPEVDHFLGSSDMLVLASLLSDGNARPRLQVGDPASYLQRADDDRVLSEAPHRAYLKIAEGCSRKCSFCAIPSFRGTQRSRAPEDVLAEAASLVAQGVVELNVISQDTVSYGHDLSPRVSLTALVERLAQLDRLGWLRLFYLYPSRLDAELARLMKEEPRVVPYVDMPLQHASDSMLMRMRRGHGGERLRRLVDRMRTEVPGLTFRTAFIVGHPGETDRDFEELYAFIEWAQFDHVGIFLYSQEEGTASAAELNAVSEGLALERRDALLTLQQGISKRKLRGRVGEVLEVLVEGESDESALLLEGRHPGQAPDVDGKVILTDALHVQPGTFIKARVTHASDYDLVAEAQTAHPSPRQLPVAQA